MELDVCDTDIKACQRKLQLWPCRQINVGPRYSVLLQAVVSICMHINVPYNLIHLKDQEIQYILLKFGCSIIFQCFTLT